MAYRTRTSRQPSSWINRLRSSLRFMTPSFTPRNTSFSEKPEMASAAAIPSPPSLYRFGLNRHQPSQNAFTRFRTPDRSFTISCPAGSSARAAEVPEAESANVRSDPIFDGNPVLPEPQVTVGMEARLRTDGREEGESDAGESEKTESKGRREEVDGRGARMRRERRATEVEDNIEGCGSKRGGRGGWKETEEEEKAVAMIAVVLREKFGPQIVREEVEEEGCTNGRITDEEDAKGRHKEEEVGYGDEKTGGLEAEAEEDEEGNEGEDAEAEEELEAEAEASEEDAPPTTSPPTPPPPRNSPRVVSPSSLLSLYRFFSSHLGISSPSTVASLLVSYPSLLRSDPTNDLLPRVQLLQLYGLSRADIAVITVRNPPWLRCSLPLVQEMLDFLLARGVRRTKLGMVLRRSHYLIRSQPRSTNLDILVERAGVPVDKLGVMIERRPEIVCVSEEYIQSRLEQVSAYFTDGYEGGNVNSGHLRQHLNQQQKEKNYLGKLLVLFPGILFKTPERVATNLRLLQSFTPPDSPSVAIQILRQAPTLFNLSSQNLLAKLQFLVELVGEKAAEKVVRIHPSILKISVENMQSKVALLSDLIGRENALLAVARNRNMLASNAENMKRSFRELVREVEEALEGGGEHGGGYARESGPFEAPQKNARGCAEQRGSGASSRAGSKSWAEATAAEEPGFKSIAAATGPGFKSIAGTTIAHEMVVNLVVKVPTSIRYSWERNTRHKVEYLKRDMGLPITEVLAFPYFLGYSLDRRIRPRHMALLSKGYVLVPHEVALPKNSAEKGGHLEGVGSGRRAEGKDKDIEVVPVYGEDEGEMDELGVRKVEFQNVSDSMQDSYALVGGKGAAGQRGVNGQLGREAVCLIQLLGCSDKEFEKRFKVELAPFMPETRP
ncbi:unnamed protein product [Closterium sp. NIES-53]